MNIGADRRKTHKLTITAKQQNNDHRKAETTSTKTTNDLRN